MVLGKFIEKLYYQNKRRQITDILSSILIKKNNYAQNFNEKHVLLWCDKNEINDEVIMRKKIDIYREF